MPFIKCTSLTSVFKICRQKNVPFLLLREQESYLSHFSPFKMYIPASCERSLISLKYQYHNTIKVYTLPAIISLHFQ